ncbi:S-layer protein precursor [Ruminiclostridium hungatei]|uniref:S-layer protein n=1 Tax=Ruminiclostridium hungatei TaxID=48256 RepID=A0A1V4SPG2_RUMHU|nr:S-layer homology domain-containing protein [Ruminiclostridium hungatei]OPX45769.1 S-layer protein precursor [Ruminiclostridium hungatei]
MKKRISGILLAGVILFSGSVTFAQTAIKVDNIVKVNFSDITGHWADGAVQALVSQGAIPFSEDKFIPGKAITRAEFAVMLHKALEIQISYFKEPQIKDYFEDIRQEEGYAPAVIDLVTAGVFEGKGTFKPQASLTREEMVHYIMKAYKYKMGDLYALIKIGPATFADADEITPGYGADAARAQLYKLIEGSGNNLFHPQKAATRAEAAVVVSKLTKVLDEQLQKIVVSPDAILTEDAIEMKIDIINNTEKEVVLNHSSGQKFDFAILDADKKVIYRWSADKMFTMALTSTVIEPGKTLELGDTLTGEQFKEIKDRMAYMKAYVIGKSDSFIIRDDGYEMKLR